MGPPVRVVCLDCLQSIEVSGSDSGNPPENCPHCGSYLDPFDPGISSRAGIDAESSLTVDLSDASTIMSEKRDLGGDRRTIGRFQIRVVLGEGGYGQVYRAFDPHLEREVALKVLKSNRLGEKALQRFYREARAAARLDHPNIVALHDAGRDDGRCWIAYQLVAGRTLSAVRDLARPSVLESIRIVRDLALGLHHAHSRGVFHRDLKPANVMIDDAGRPRLTDFGLARRDDIESDLTVEGTVLGTPQYMSPEAAAGRAHEADARSDVYSLGVILYELLCGRRPCDVPSGALLWRSVQHATPPTPRSVDRAIPPLLDRICMKALALNPVERYANAELFATALTDQIAKYRPSRSLKSIETITRIAHPRFRRLGSLAVVSTLCLVAVGSALLLGGPDSGRIPRQPPPAPVGEPSPLEPIRATAAIRPPGRAEAEVVEGEVAPEADHTPALAGEPPVGAASPRALPPLVASSKGKSYHRVNCPIAKSIAYPQRFDSIEEAIQFNPKYTPCRSCRPDTHPELFKANQ